jgi:hypothetical protein
MNLVIQFWAKTESWFHVITIAPKALPMNFTQMAPLLQGAFKLPKNLFWTYLFALVMVLTFKQQHFIIPSSTIFGDGWRLLSWMLEESLMLLWPTLLFLLGLLPRSCLSISGETYPVWLHHLPGECPECHLFCTLECGGGTLNVSASLYLFHMPAISGSSHQSRPCCTGRVDSNESL